MHCSEYLSQIVFILVLGAMKRKDQNRKPQISHGYLTFINDISPHRHHCQIFTTMHNCIFCVPDEAYSISVPCAQNVIATFLSFINIVLVYNVNLYITCV
jgi:hypothetical protein